MRMEAEMFLAIKATADCTKISSSKLVGDALVQYLPKLLSEKLDNPRKIEEVKQFLKSLEEEKRRLEHIHETRRINQSQLDEQLNGIALKYKRAYRDLLNAFAEASSRIAMESNRELENVIRAHTTALFEEYPNSK